MLEESPRITIGHLLRETLKKQSLSMRKLSEQTDIDTATISRIINHKRNATLEHLEKLSSVLNLPLAELLESAGYPLENHKESASAYHETIEQLLRTSELLSANISMNSLEKQLKNYETFSQSAEGEERILHEFEEKLKGTGGTGPFIDQMKNLFSRFKTRNGDAGELAIIGSALLYFIVPIDVIPDYLFAVGYLDDALAVQIASSAVTKNS
ncbi:DUF1232 domain-containing protein [Sporosarcina sp.]|uniref:DUF1232 domain-containing protein n=1 Tax=Sporosarcina sp. TaxID=49982 RepID=UPI0026380FE1|nr:DUF1232 domain-containing protein [Sporosarcina sp.]